MSNNIAVNEIVNWYLSWFMGINIVINLKQKKGETNPCLNNTVLEFPFNNKEYTEYLYTLRTEMAEKFRAYCYRRNKKSSINIERLIQYREEFFKQELSNFKRWEVYNDRMLYD